VRDNQQLSGKVAIVTGAATGIGAATAALFLEHGASVFAVDIKEPGDVLAATLAEVPAHLHFQHLDVTSEQDWREGVAACTERFGSPQVLVNNAGRLGSGRPVHEETAEEMRLVFEVNTVGMMLGMKAVIPGMLETGQGAIVNISSVWGLTAVANNAAYQIGRAHV